jgi:transcriptional regulator with XRE-family HTH domain
VQWASDISAVEARRLKSGATLALGVVLVVGIERGERNPTLRAVWKIADALELRPSDLKEENRVLRELHGNKRQRFNDDQRSNLANLYYCGAGVERDLAAALHWRAGRSGRASS